MLRQPKIINIHAIKKILPSVRTGCPYSGRRFPVASPTAAGESVEEAPPKEKSPFPNSNGFAYVLWATGSLPGPVALTEAHRQCKQWLVDQFKATVRR